MSKREDTLFERPPSVTSGEPLRQKVVVTHRSDILVEEQVSNVKTTYDALRRLLLELEVAKSPEDVQFLEQQASALQGTLEQMLVVLKVMQKINAELDYARADLKRALSHGGDINNARKRIGWLDDRLERLLGKKQTRGPGHSGMKSSMTVSGSKFRQGSLMSAGDIKNSEMSDMSSVGDMDTMGSSGSPLNTFRSKSLMDLLPGETRGLVLPIPEGRETETPSHDPGSDPGQRSPDTGQRSPNRDSAEKELLKEQRKAEKKQKKKEKKREKRRLEKKRALEEDWDLKEKTHISGAGDQPSPEGSEEDSGHKGGGDQLTQGQDRTFVTQAAGSSSHGPQGETGDDTQAESDEKAPPVQYESIAEEDDTMENGAPESVAAQSTYRSSASEPLPPVMGISITQPEGVSEVDEGSEVEGEVVSPETDHQGSPLDPQLGAPGDSQTGRETSETSDVSSVSSVSTDDSDQDSDDSDSSNSSGTSETKTYLTELSALSPILRSQDTMSRRSKGSRVTIRSPQDIPEVEVVERPESVEEDFGTEYWKSEHHRFDWSDNYNALLENDPLSYHLMGLAVPGTFVREVSDRGPELPWRIKSPGSDISDIHSRALDRLHTQVHKLYDKVRDAALVSVKGTDDKAQTFMAAVKKQATLMQDIDKRSLDDDSIVVSKPTLAKFGLARPSSQETVVFPPLKKERLGSTISGRLVYYPRPLPYPEKLPITRTNHSKEYPRTSNCFSQSQPGLIPAAERIVNQRNLLNETKFTSSLFRSKAPPRKVAVSNNEQRFRKMLKEDNPTPVSRNSKTSGAKTPKTPERKIPNLRATVAGAKALLKFKAADPMGLDSWKKMKPLSGALDHSGLKWERVKAIVHNNLSSDMGSERGDAARHLGAMRCGEPMVIFALKDRMENDEDERVVYEATKALMNLGTWDDAVLAQIVHYLLAGNRDIKADILKTIIDGKNVQYVDKRLPNFPELTRTLSLLCKSQDPDDVISFTAAICLGKLCVYDGNAKEKLNIVLQGTTNNHDRAKALDILVRQMNQGDWDTVTKVLDQLKHSPVWKYRKDACRHLIHLGHRKVCVDGDVAIVYELLERQLWDDPNKNVRLEVAKALAALELFARACEQIEKRLEDTQEEVRAQAVISIGTLGMKSERIYRALLEMIELDSSEYVRLMILRTFGVLNTQDKRVMRVLRDKEKGDGPLAREATRTLTMLSTGRPPPTARSGGQK